MPLFYLSACRVKYTSEIVEGPDGPLFHVTGSDNPDFVIIKKTATSAWRHMWMHLTKAGSMSDKGHAPSGPVRGIAGWSAIYYSVIQAILLFAEIA